MTIAILVVIGACACFLFVMLALAMRAAWKVEKDAGRVRRGLLWVMPRRDTLALWKDEPWAKDLEEPEFRQEPGDHRP